ncbi:HAMP domain-containing sensor histidine kinase [Pleionea sp. CnH1-48]|uniref:sensor histidine kinase n=1 Tax=Pleionea sp. CnH1-48 TaxID=2954494 RepID=UPI0020968166|nr:HAMP domain-containing sensor histidine kinase [Pleionea sp. CnH1-48]MCO7223753.1 ATP-binding protein [Pleionea sp. CnH1-48]
MMFNRIYYGRFPRTIAFALVLGVFVPTAFILWFMVEAMQNERFAARQKVVEVYREQLMSAHQRWEEHWRQKINQLEQLSQRSLASQALFQQVIERKIASSILIEPKGTKAGYPVTGGDFSASIAFPDQWSNARALEFRQRNFSAALKEYQYLAHNHHQPLVRALAYQAAARCLIKLEQPKRALSTLEELYTQSQFSEVRNLQGRLVLAHALLQARDLLAEMSDSSAQLKVVEGRLVELVNHYSAKALDAKQRWFIMNQLESLQQHMPTYRAEQLAHDYLKTKATSMEQGVLSGTAIENLWLWKLGGTGLGILITTEFLQQELDSLYAGRGYSIKLQPPLPAQAYHHEGQPVAESVAIGDFMPGWRLNLYLDSKLMSSETSEAKVAAYLWIGVLLVVSMVIVYSFVVRYIFTREKLHTLKNDLMATVTHELKTPLSSMRLFVEILLNDEEDLSPRTQEYLLLIDQENRRLTRLIENFLTFSRMERGKQVFQREQVCALDVIEAALAPFYEKLKAEQFIFETPLPETLPDIEVDIDLMVVAISNLLENAYKYSVERKHITVTTRVVEQALYIDIVDQGIGLSRNDCKKIYDGFYRVDQSLAQNIDGCGIGLNITKYIVEHHQGDITVESELGVGSTFTIRLPVCEENS